MSKPCKSCGAIKPLADFYAARGCLDGRMGKCKECWRAQVRERRRTNPAVQAYDVARAKTPERRAHSARVSRQWRIDNPEGYRAQTIVGNAIRDGKLKKQPCETCGATENLHAHYDDYGKPLNVRWKCAKHHHRDHAAEI